MYTAHAFSVTNNYIRINFLNLMIAAPKPSYKKSRHGKAAVLSPATTDVDDVTDSTDMLDLHSSDLSLSPTHKSRLKTMGESKKRITDAHSHGTYFSMQKEGILIKIPYIPVHCVLFLVFYISRHFFAVTLMSSVECSDSTDVRRRVAAVRYPLFM